MTSGAIVNAFSGAGGWEEGARMLGLHEEIVGIEVMAEALATARAAGHTAVEMSVTEEIVKMVVAGFIASPPCQAFSSGGKRLGRHDIPIIMEALEWLWARACAGREHVHEPLPSSFAERCLDARSILVVEPLRWILALRPEWIALEQVPAVLPLWEWLAVRLRAVGYSVWCGKLRAEEYGVPQTRERAILVASRVREVDRPAPTHQGYDARKKAPKKGTENRRPYVTMGDALGWSPDALVGFARRADGKGASIEIDGESYRERDLRPASAPAHHVTEKTRSWTIVGNNSVAGGPLAEREAEAPAMTVGSRADLWKMRPNSRANATERRLDEPAATITGGHDHGERVWIPPEGEEVPAGLDRRQSGKGGAVRVVGIDEPSRTVTSNMRARDVWVFDRPATTISGDPRVQPPGHKINQADRDAGREDYDGRAGTNAIRVTLEQALVLQSFRADYPVQGSRSKGFLQVGNAVPPRLAAHVLAEATGVPCEF